jgi:hypothetical protein
MQNTPEVESPKNNIPTRHNKQNKATLYYRQNNYCRQCITPKISKPVSNESQYSMESQKVGFTQYQYTKLQICIFD